MEYQEFLNQIIRQQLVKTIEYWSIISNANKTYFTEIMDMNLKLWESMGAQMWIDSILNKKV